METLGGGDGAEGNHLLGLFLEGRCKSVKSAPPLKPDIRDLVNFCIFSLEPMSSTYLTSEDKNLRRVSSI